MTPRPCNDYPCYGALEIVGAITITIISIDVKFAVLSHFVSGSVQDICLFSTMDGIQNQFDVFLLSCSMSLHPHGV